MPNPKPLRLSNPFVSTPAEDRLRVQGVVSRELYIYLFRHVHADQGAQQSIIATLLVRLGEAAQAAGVALPAPGADLRQARWDESNEAALAQLLLNLNFNEPVNSDSRPRPPRSPRTRRTNQSSPVAPPQPTAD